MTSIRDRIQAAEAKPNVTAAELALLVGVGIETVRRAGRAGRIPVLQIGRSVRYPREDAIRAMLLTTVDDCKRLLTTETADV